MSREQVPDEILNTVRGLYCDGRLPNMGQQLIFHDPLVRIDTLPEVLRMFDRLRRLFPRTELTRFEPLESVALTDGRTTTTYLLEICYRRRTGGSGHPMRSHLAVTTDGGHVVKLVEDWKAPLQVGADSVPALHSARALLGRLCGLSLGSLRRRAARTPAPEPL